MAGIGTKPSMLAKPVPGQDLQASLAPQAMPAQAQVAAAEPIDPEVTDGMPLTPEEIDKLDEIYSASSSAMPEELTADEFAKLDEIYKSEAPTSTETRSLGENLDQLPTRIKASFARTDKELRAVLDARYEKDNVRKKRGQFEIKQDGKWQAFDPASGAGDVMGDVADFGRDVVEGAVSVPARLAGAVGGMLGGGPVGAYVGQAVTGAAGSAIGTQIGDMIAEEGFGIPRDPERSKLEELGVSAGFGAVLGPVGKWLGGKIAQRQATRETVSVADKLMSEAAQDLGELEKKQIEAGLLKPVGNSGKVLTPDELAFENADQRAIKEVLAGDDNYKNFILERVGMINEGMQKLFGREANLSAQKTGKEIVLGIDDVLKAEGKLIGDYRESLAKKAGYKPLRADNYRARVDEVAQRLGFDREIQGSVEGGFQNQVLKAPSVDDLLAKQIVSTEAEAKGLIRFMNNELEQAFNKNGEYTAREITAKLAELNAQTSRAFKNKSASFEARQAFLDLKNAMRDDELKAMDGFFQSERGFQDIKNKYGALKDATGALGNLLKTDDISGTALARGVFTKGKDGLKNLRAAKTILEANNPQGYRDLMGHYLGDLIERNTDELAGRATKTSYAKIGKELNQLGPEMLEEMFGKQGSKETKEFFEIASRVDKGDIGFMESTKNLGLLKRALILGSGTFLGARVDAGTKILATLGKDEALAKFLSSQANQDLILKGIPKVNQAPIRSQINAILESSSKKAAKAGANVTKQQLIKANAESNSQPQE